MKLLRTLTFVTALFGALSLQAQSASLTTDSTKLSSNGGTVVLTATAVYESNLAALGWTIGLPEGWSLERVDGPNVPGIKAPRGSTGLIEFAYTEVPEQRAEFTVTVRYPAGVRAGDVVPAVIVRKDGNLVTLKPQPLSFTEAVNDPSKPFDR